MRLAVETYPPPQALRDGPDLLSLAWTSDEQAMLDVELPRLIAEQLQAEIVGDLRLTSSYPLWDPHSEAALAPHVAGFFRLSAPIPALFAGAGIGSLLAALAADCRLGPAQVIGTTYPDFPAWVERLGGTFVPHGGGDGIRGQIEIARRTRPRVIFMERPQIFRSEELSADDVAEMCRAVPEAIVLVDESNANYCVPDYSLVPRVAGLSNLVVLRGFSKAYQMGGLRLGYCAASSKVADRVRRLVPPLLASPLSVGIGGAILRQGDIGRRLRRAIGRSRRRSEELLLAAGCPPDHASHPALPYLLYDVSNESLQALEARGIRGKRHVFWRPESGLGCVYRLSVPLAGDRASELKRRLGGMGADSAAGS